MQADCRLLPCTRRSVLGTRHSALRAGRGSVLVFAIIILGLLAMLGTTYLMVVRQCSRASSNALGSVEAELAAKAALNHALAVLRATAAQHATVTPDGVFVPVAPYKETSGDPDQQGPPWVSYCRQFACDPTTANKAYLSVDPTDTAKEHELRFTSAPLRVSPGANAQFTAATPLEDCAFKWEVQGYTNDLYRDPAQPPRTIKELPRVSSVRGVYYVWVDDYDAKLNAMPHWPGQARPSVWGIDTPDPAKVTGSPLPEDVEREILEQLNDNAVCPLGLAAADLDYVMNPPAQPYDSIADFALDMPSLDPVTAASQDLRATLDYYFTAKLDDDRRAKLLPGALNINTASLEVLEAALSQIPAYNEAQKDDNTLTFGAKTVTGGTLAHALAARIVAKRPFLCRMDFEDFAAAHLVGDKGNKNTELGAVFYALQFRRRAPGDDRSEINAHQYMEIPGNTEDPPTYAMYEQMLKGPSIVARFNYFNEGATAAPLQLKEFNNLLNSVFNRSCGNEKVVSAGDDRQVTAPGVECAPGTVVIHPGKWDAIANQPPVLDILLSPNNATPPSTVIGQDVLGAIVIAGPDRVLQTRPKAGSDDVLVREAPVLYIAAGPDGLLQSAPAGDDRIEFAFPTLPGAQGVIVPGPNGVLESALAGDDVRVASCTAYIAPGLNGALDTAPAAGSDDQVVQAVLAGEDPPGSGIYKAHTSIFGFSYYSHDTSGQDYKPFKTFSEAGDAAAPVKAADPQYVGKFVYGDAAASFQPKTTTFQNKNYLMDDLSRWSCVGNGERSGYYDLFFNPQDVMLMEYLEQLPPADPLAVPPVPAPDPDTVVVKPMVANTPLRTGWGSDDVQETGVGEGADAETVVVSPGPNGALETKTSGNDIMVEAIRLGEFSITVAEQDDEEDWGFASGQTFILPGPNGVLDTEAVEADGDQKVSVIVDGSGYDPGPPPTIIAGAGDTLVPTDNDDSFRLDGTTETIVIGQNFTNDTFVWGPLRASQRQADQVTPRRPEDPPEEPTVVLNLEQIPSAAAPGQVPTSGARADGDVAWSPQFAFHSRFFGIYVLAHGLVRGWGNPEVDPNDPNLRDPARLKVVGERRLEALYDAVKDEVIWQRAPVSEKRSLAGP